MRMGRKLINIRPRLPLTFNIKGIIMQAIEFEATAHNHTISAVGWVEARNPTFS